MNIRTAPLFLCFFFCLVNLSAQATGEFLPEEIVQNADTLEYKILYPENFSEEREYPLVFFLHGAGERGDDNEAQLIHGSDLFLNNKEHPAIVIFPQCPTSDYWANVEVERESTKSVFNFRQKEEPTEALSLVMRLLNKMLQKDFVKKDQVYLAGLSMGGMGTFELLARKPDTFAAAIAICGGGNTEAVSKNIGNTEVWIFHGARDQVVDPQYSIDMAKAINAAGGKANLTIYGDAAHNSWDPAFEKPNLLNWLFSKKLEK